jgi:DNA polymerase III subunit delta'
VINNAKKLFEHIPGNDHIKTSLVNMVQKQCIGNSLLFAGPEEASKDQFALALAKLLLGESASDKIEAGNHPDMHIYRPEGKIGMHSIASMRQFCEEVYLPPYEGAWKVFILHDAERMLTYSANALLKTFEEPALDSVIILLSSYPNRLLPTILSRCRIVRFQSVGNKLKRRQGSPVRSEVYTILTKGKVGTYTELSKGALQIAEHIEEIQKAEEEAFKAESPKIPSDQLNAFQRNAIEKELEGAATLRINQQARDLVLDIISWYRDMHLIHAGGQSELMENPDFQEEINQSYQRGEMLPLELVEKAVKNALLSLERSTAFNLCLEKLFLELQLI